MPSTITERFQAILGRVSRVGAQALATIAQRYDGSDYYDEPTVYQGHPAPQLSYGVIGQGMATGTGPSYVTVAEANSARIGGIEVGNPLKTGGADIHVSFNDAALAASGFIIRAGNNRHFATTAKVRAWIPTGAGPMNVSYAEYGVS